MAEETSAEPIFSNISTTLKWTYSVHHSARPVKSLWRGVCNRCYAA